MSEIMITTHGELHIDPDGYAPEDVALAALREEFPDPEEYAELLREVSALAKKAINDHEPDWFDHDRSPVEASPGEAILDEVAALFGKYVDVWLVLEVHRDAEGRIFAWQIEREGENQEGEPR